MGMKTKHRTLRITGRVLAKRDNARHRCAANLNGNGISIKESQVASVATYSGTYLACDEQKTEFFAINKTNYSKNLPSLIIIYNASS